METFLNVANVVACQSCGVFFALDKLIPAHVVAFLLVSHHAQNIFVHNFKVLLLLLSLGQRF
jgi:hypothetical protein